MATSTTSSSTAVAKTPPGVTQRILPDNCVEPGSEMCWIMRPRAWCSLTKLQLRLQGRDVLPQSHNHHVAIGAERRQLPIGAVLRGRPALGAVREKLQARIG